MKLYKNTLITSIIVFFICVILSFIFGLTCVAEFKIVQIITDYLIGIACSVVVVIITTFLQFKYEQKKLVNSVLSETQFLLFYYLLVVCSLYPDEETPKKTWEHYYDEIYDAVKKISLEISNIEWFSCKKSKAINKIQQSVLQLMIDIAKSSANDKKDGLVNSIDIDCFKNIKDNVLLVANEDEYMVKEIIRNYDRIQEELKALESCQEKDMELLEKN